jgi:hypothetical protein
MKRLLTGTVLVLVATFAAANAGFAAVIQFTAGDIVNNMAAQGAPLSDATNQWGLWAIRVMPTGISGGGYTITGGATSQTGWGVSAPNGAFGAAPYTPTNSAWFYDESGSEVAGTPANPLYMIMTQPANTFTNYTLDAGGHSIGSVPPDAVVPPQPGGGGTNVVTPYEPS